MTQSSFMGVPSSPQFAQHGAETIAGLIQIARMRQQAAQDHVARLEQALAAIEYMAQLCIETRQTYIDQINADQAAIEQFVQFSAAGSFAPIGNLDPALVQAAQAAPQQLVAAPPAGPLMPMPAQASPFGGQPLRPMAVDARPDAEGRRPVAVITPEMREQWKTAPPVEVKTAGPGEEGYVPTPGSMMTTSTEVTHVGSDQPAVVAPSAGQ